MKILLLDERKSLQPEIFTSPQPLPREGGAKLLITFMLPPSLLGEGGQGG